MGLFDKWKPQKPPKSKAGELTPEQIADDMKRYAQANPYLGGLHAIDRQEAQKQWREKKQEDSGQAAPAVLETVARSAAMSMAVPADTRAPLSKADIRPCVEHPGERGIWRCVDCGRNFCAGCVRPVMSFYNTSHGGYEHRSAVCPACKGRCADLQFEGDKQDRIRAKADQEARAEGFRKTILYLLAAQFVLSAVFKLGAVDLALDLQFMLFVFGIVQYGPLRSLELVTKSYFIRILPAALVANGMLHLWRTVLAEGKDSFLNSGLLGKTSYWIAYAFVGTPVKYLGIALLMYFGVLFIEKAADLVGHIYKGSQEATGWNRTDRVFAVLSGGLIILFVCLLLSELL